jgi:hypothetical protein
MPATQLYAITEIARVDIFNHLFHSLCHSWGLVLFLKLGKVFIDFLFALFIILEFFESMGLINEIFKLFKFWEFGYTVIKQPPERGRLGSLWWLLAPRGVLVGVCVFGRAVILGTYYRFNEGSVLYAEIRDSTLLHVLESRFKLFFIHVMKALLGFRETQLVIILI